MTTKALTTDADLAEDWGLTLDEFHALRRRHRWPVVKLGRWEYRFTDEMVEQIVEQMTVTPQRGHTSASTGLTARSAARLS